MSSHISNVRPAPDQLIVAIADYALEAAISSDEAYDTARWCLADTLACGIMALAYPACTKLPGPVVPGTTIKNGARVPGTAYELDPVQGAFNIGTIVRWLDFNDTWLAAEWGHPSDNLGAILATADWLSRSAAAVCRYEPSPGRRKLRLPTGNISHTIRKNQPLATETIEFHTSPMAANGSSSWNNRCHREKPLMAHASISSRGMLFSEV